MIENYLAVFNMPWDKLIDASLFATGVVFGAVYSGRTHRRTIDFERKRCEKFDGQLYEMRKEAMEAYNKK